MNREQKSKTKYSDLRKGRSVDVQNAKITNVSFLASIKVSMTKIIGNLKTSSVLYIITTCLDDIHLVTRATQQRV